LLEQEGYEVTWLGVDGNGELNLDELRAALRPDTALVSIMLANNETGVLFPIEEIGRVVRRNPRLCFTSMACRQLARSRSI
jgi:cysteine desulfurase